MDGNLFITVSVSLDHHAPPRRPFLFPGPIPFPAPWSPAHRDPAV